MFIRKMKWWLREKGQHMAPRLTLALLARRVWVHEPEVTLLPMLADPDSTAIDAGANKGIYVHHLCHSYKRVIAFEPLPALAKFLKRAAHRAEVHGMALSDRHGHACLKLPVGFNELGTIEEMETFTENTDLPFEKHDVKISPLDSFDFQNVGLIKIDVEGHELAVLAGAKKLIKNSKPTILVEVEERHKAGSIDEVSTFFEKLNYDGYFLDGDRFRSFCEFNKDKDQRLDFLVHSEKKGRYINNFIFIHRNQSHERAAKINQWLSSRTSASGPTRELGLGGLISRNM